MLRPIDRRQANGPSIWAASLLLVVFVALCVTMVVTRYIETRENVEARCYLSEPPAIVEVSEAALIRAEVTSFPAGRLCVWRATDGGVIEQQTGWLVTGAALIGSAGTLVVSLHLLRRGKAVRATIALLLAAGCWFLVFV